MVDSGRDPGWPFGVKSVILVTFRWLSTQPVFQTTTAPDSFLFLISGANSAVLGSVMSMAKEIQRPKLVNKML